MKVAVCVLSALLWMAAQGGIADALSASGPPLPQTPSSAASPPAVDTPGQAVPDAPSVAPRTPSLTPMPTPAPTSHYAGPAKKSAAIGAL